MCWAEPRVDRMGSGARTPIFVYLDGTVTNVTIDYGTIVVFIMKCDTSYIMSEQFLTKISKKINIMSNLKRKCNKLYTVILYSCDNILDRCLSDQSRNLVNFHSSSQKLIYYEAFWHFLKYHNFPDVDILSKAVWTNLCSYFDLFSSSRWRHISHIVCAASRRPFRTSTSG